MISARLLLMPALLALALAACTSPPMAPFSTTEVGPPMVETSRVERLVVLPVVEARPGDGHTRLGWGALVLIPLVPYGTQEWRTIEEQWDVRPELGDMITQDLRASGLAADTLHGTLEQAGPSPAAYVLEVRLREGVWLRHMTTYGLSVFGGVLWYLGAPVSYGEAHLNLSVELRDPRGEVLGSRSFHTIGDVTESIYRGEPATLGFKEAYEALSPELRAFVAECLGDTRA